MIGTPWYRSPSFLNALYFSIRNGMPLADVAPQLPIPAGPARKLTQTLKAGGSFREALRCAGVPARAAALLDLQRGGSIASVLLELNLEAVRRESRVAAIIAQAFAYPNVVVVLTVFCWYFLTGAGIAIRDPLWNLLFVGSLTACFAVQAVLFLPRRRAPFLRGIRLLEDSGVLFLHLLRSLQLGLDEREAMRTAVEELDLGRAAGVDAVARMRDGEPLVSVLAQMPGVAEIQFGIPHTERVQPLLETLARATEEEWKRRTARLALLLRTLGLLGSGSALLALTVQVFLAVYAARSY